MRFLIPLALAALVLAAPVPAQEPSVTAAVSEAQDAAGTGVGYVKPHGALYNAIVHHEEHAGAVVDADADDDLSDLSGTVRTDAALALPVTTTLIPGVVPAAEAVAEPKPKKAKA